MKNTAKKIQEAVAARIARDRGNILPAAGNGVGYSVGSDSYGYVITNVAPDLSWFTYSDKMDDQTIHGVAKLCIQKNSHAYGNYIDCGRRYFEDDRLGVQRTLEEEVARWEPRKPWCSCGCRYYNTVHVTAEAGPLPTYLDPSF